MRWLWLGIALVSGCTAPNPRSCADGTCGDPALPFCDVNGTLGGLPNECIAPACESGAFAECRGDSEVRCNAGGDGYTVSQCANGCDATIGCRRCEPNETVCTNGSVMTCDASGSVIPVEDCPLGCFESEPRCRVVDPSNGLGMYVDMVPSPQDLDLGGGGSIDATAGTITMTGGESLDVPTYLVPAPPDGAPIRLFVARNVTLGDVSVRSDDGYAGPAVALIATGSIEVDGAVNVLTGGLTSTSCNGGRGPREVRNGDTLIAGAGGGGHATSGGAGGNITFNGEPPPAPIVGAQGGSSAGTETLVPLRGGCAGGSDSTTASYGARGGGALQLTSERSIVIRGVIYARGANGNAQIGLSSSAGGGGGGGVLLEAPVIELFGDGAISAVGGAGGGCNGLSPLFCSAGGAGATAMAMAGNGTERRVQASQGTYRAGGGGGGLGRIRINTRDATYTASSSFKLDGALATGTLATH